MTRIIKRLVVVATVALAAAGVSVATATAASADEASSVVHTDEHDWS